MAQSFVLTNSPNQILTISPTVNGTTLTLNLFIRYNELAGYWVMDIADANNTPILYGVPLITGYYPAANILAPYAYLEIGTAFVINANGGATDFPNDANIGQFLLIWDSN